MKSRIKVRVGMNEEENGLDDFLKINKKIKSKSKQLKKLTSPTAVDAVEDAE